MKIALTGAAGSVARQLRPLLAQSCEQLRCGDKQCISSKYANECFLQGDFTNTQYARQLLEGADALIHLGGLVGPDFSYEQVMHVNVNGTHELLKAAARQGIQKIIYASSHHAVGFASRGDPLNAESAARPDSYYGLSKAFGESLCSYFADKFQLSILTIRIGYVAATVPDERRMHTWCSARDLLQLISLGLHKTDIGHRIVYGVSNNPTPFFDNAAAEKMGYHPQDCSLDHLEDASLASAKTDPNAAESHLIGGHFATNSLSLA